MTPPVWAIGAVLAAALASAAEPPQSAMVGDTSRSPDVPSSNEHVSQIDHGADVASRECGWTPSGTTGPLGAFLIYPAGCGLAPVVRDAWRSVTDFNPISLEMLPGRTRVRAVFLNAQGQRVLPVGQVVTYDLRFAQRRRGRIRLALEMQRDGVFTFDLPSARKPAPCKLHLTMRFGNGRRTLSLSIDDWEYSC
jgi:hypothetical protein